MSRRRWYILLGGCLALTVAVGVAWMVMLAGRPPAITLNDFRHVERGWTVDEVRAFLGPPTDPRPEWPNLDGKGHWEAWSATADDASEVRVLIKFGDDGRVVAKCRDDDCPRKLWDRIREYLPW